VFFGSARVDSRERAERALKTMTARGDRDAREQYEKELTKSRKSATCRLLVVSLVVKYSVPASDACRRKSSQVRS